MNGPPVSFQPHSKHIFSKFQTYANKAQRKKNKKMPLLNTIIATAGAAATAFAIATTEACSNVRVDLKNSTAWLQARTMELSYGFGGKLAHLDNYALKLNPATSEENELSCSPVVPILSAPFKSKIDHPFVSINMNGTITAFNNAQLNVVTEGMNDKGLTISVQFLKSASWGESAEAKANASSALSEADQVPWSCFADVILGKCATVKDV